MKRIQVIQFMRDNRMTVCAVMPLAGNCGIMVKPNLPKSAITRCWKRITAMKVEKFRSTEVVMAYLDGAETIIIPGVE